MPLLILLIIIIGIPLMEIAIFIQVGDAIGVMPTLAAVVLGTIIGVGVVRAQGIGVFNRLRKQMDAGERPEREVFEAFCLLIAGFCILIPGFFTDAAGILLMLPPVRAHLFKSVAKAAEARGATVKGNVVIEAEYEELDETTGGPAGESGAKREDQGPERLP